VPIYNLTFNYKLECIRAFLSRAFDVDDNYMRMIEGQDRDDSYRYSFGDVEHAGDILIGYYDIVVRAALYELNALVELEITSLAGSIVRGREARAKRLNFHRARAIVESHYGIRMTDLPRFAEVDELRRIVNAYKHDDGFSSAKTHVFGNIFKQERHSLQWERAISALDAVREFLLALPGHRQMNPETRIIDR
jgi:hypothetical protein